MSMESLLKGTRDRLHAVYMELVSKTRSDGILTTNLQQGKST
jgi:hypothetical protein